MHLTSYISRHVKAINKLVHSIQLERDLSARYLVANDSVELEKLSITAIKNKEGKMACYITQSIDIGDLKEAEDRAIHQANHDFLTGLPNRKSMIEKVEEEFVRAKRHNFLDAFLFLDLDGLKKINDSFGHSIGDRVLIEVAQRLYAITRADDYIARISGDEFGIVLVNLDNDEERAAHSAKTVCEHIIKSIAEPFKIDQYTILLDISIGVKLFPDGNKDINDIINGADAAMYKAKENGKNRYVFFNEELEYKIKELSNLESEITQALVNNEFIFYFQPKVDTNTQKIKGVEILVRWEHPQKGIVYPDKFIDVIKEMGRLSDITFQAIESACNYLAQYSNIEGSLSINVSSVELISNNFLEKVLNIVSRCGVDAKHLEFEILENELIENFDLVLESTTKLKAHGIWISIDDFGTGYSSISYLRKLSVNTLKIDCYFV